MSFIDQGRVLLYQSAHYPYAASFARFHERGSTVGVRHIAVYFRPKIRKDNERRTEGKKQEKWVGRKGNS